MKLLLKLKIPKKLLSYFYNVARKTVAKNTNKKKGFYAIKYQNLN